MQTGRKKYTNRKAVKQIQLVTLGGMTDKTDGWKKEEGQEIGNHINIKVIKK